MSSPQFSPFDAVVVEEEVHLSLTELSRACRAHEALIRVWVVEGVLEPVAGQSEAEWRFAGPALRRARLAARLTRDLDVNSAGVAVALDLLDRIAALEARLQRLGSA